MSDKIVEKEDINDEELNKGVYDGELLNNKKHQKGLMKYKNGIEKK